MKTFKLPMMLEDEIRNLLDDQKICRIAFQGEDYPYLAPFQYTQLNGALYFHFTNYGRKMKLVLRDKKVCVSIEKLESDMSKYSFLSIMGSLEEVVDDEERMRAIKKLSSEGRERYSKKFLAAHGLGLESEWGDLLNKKPLVVFKLKDITNRIGLKSP
jgi:nitroimidazol reductase NimA-like FMN-containing flavoprotein (pyridoxamine 5'-phosphate oxidase superfamily)